MQPYVSPYKQQVRARRPIRRVKPIPKLAKPKMVDKATQTPLTIDKATQTPPEPKKVERPKTAPPVVKDNPPARGWYTQMMAPGYYNMFYKGSG